MRWGQGSTAQSVQGRRNVDLDREASLVKVRRPGALHLVLVSVELGHQRLDPSGDVLPDQAHFLERLRGQGPRGPNRRSACPGCTGTRRRSPSSPGRLPRRRQLSEQLPGNVDRRGRVPPRPSHRRPADVRGRQGRSQLSGPECRPAAARSNSAWLICERPALWRQTNRTRAIRPRLLPAHELVGERAERRAADRADEVDPEVASTRRRRAPDRTSGPGSSRRR